MPADPSPAVGAKRWTNICLRALHLVGGAGVGGGVLLQAPLESWQVYLWLAVFSGAAMLLLDVWSSAVSLIQVRGLATIAKIALLSCMSLLEGYQAHLLIAAIVLAGVVSHAPARVRYFSIFHGREIDTL